MPLLEVNFDQAGHASITLVTMEWLNDGQHVEKYAIEVWNESQHKWEPVAGGEAIGHEKIDSFPAVTASRVRLNILSSTGEAHIREFQLFDWSKPRFWLAASGPRAGSERPWGHGKRPGISFF